jgi:hypothetical protein
MQKKKIVEVEETEESDFSDDGMPIVRKADPLAKANRRIREVSAKKAVAPKQPRAVKPAKEPKPEKKIAVKVKKEKPERIVAVKAVKEKPERIIAVKAFPVKEASTPKPAAPRNKNSKQEVKLGAAITDVPRVDPQEKVYTHEIPETPGYKEAVQNALGPAPYLKESLDQIQKKLDSQVHDEQLEDYFDNELYGQFRGTNERHAGLKSRTVKHSPKMHDSISQLQDMDEEFDAVFSRAPIPAKSNVSRHATKLLENEWEQERKRLLETLEESRPSFSNMVKKKRHEYVPVVVGKIVCDVTAIFLGDLVVHEAFDGKIDGVQGFDVHVGLDAPLFSEEQVQLYVFHPNNI